ncbi:MAG: peptidase M48 Ste24p [Sphingomonadales bacterium]|nr:MAG: peptidase M48 Ste24p [Sphingomonadales bacterium]
MIRNFTRSVTVGCACLGLLTSCVTNPATGEKDFTPLMSPAQERALGVQEHPKMLAEFGGAYPDPKISGYVAEVGGRMAANSELPNLGFTFTLLNSDIVNAFALPGGYVYISRQLLALMNSEAELASVLGHEVGHVTARHSARRYNREVFGNLAAVGLGIALGSNQIAQAASQVSQIATLSYSRDQEFQADDLGIRYITRAGYDPYAAAAMLNSLGAQTSLDARITGKNADQTPSWARTHPLSADRVVRAGRMADASQVAPGSKPTNSEAFLDTIDGLLVDDDPTQGVVQGTRFLHPTLRFGFQAPDGFRLQNSPQAVVIQGASGQAQFAGGALQPGQSLADYAGALWSSLTGSAGPVPVGTTLSGLPAARAGARLNGQSGPVDVQIVVYRWSDTKVYHFITLAKAGQSSAFEAMLNSLRRLSDQDVRGIKVKRIRVIAVGPGDSIESLARRMAYPDYQVQRFTVLNALAGPEDLKTRKRVKLVVEAPL